jgi:hypothetical protein
LVLATSDLDAPLYMEFYDDGSYLTTGQCTTLHWDVQNATEVTLNDNPVEREGYQYECPESTTAYVLRARNDAEERHETITVVVSAQQSQSSAAGFDFAASCVPMSAEIGPGFIFHVHYSSQRGRPSGSIRAKLYVGEDANNMNYIGSITFEYIENGGSSPALYYGPEPSCQIVLQDNHDDNPANDTYYMKYPNE